MRHIGKSILRFAAPVACLRCRAKNEKAQASQILKGIRCQQRLLLTGTPTQVIKAIPRVDVITCFHTEQFARTLEFVKFPVPGGGDLYGAHICNNCWPKIA